MHGGWWWISMVLIVLFFVSPVSYGWAFRGWGPPYPSYVQNRRKRHAVAIQGAPTFDHTAWGWKGDLVWLALLVGVICAFVLPWWS
jgi:hypothetical protein